MSQAQRAAWREVLQDPAFLGAVLAMLREESLDTVEKALMGLLALAKHQAGMSIVHQQSIAECLDQLDVRLQGLQGEDDLREFAGEIRVLAVELKGLTGALDPHQQQADQIEHHHQQIKDEL